MYRSAGSWHGRHRCRPRGRERSAARSDGRRGPAAVYSVAVGNGESGIGNRGIWGAGATSPDCRSGDRCPIPDSQFPGPASSSPFLTSLAPSSIGFSIWPSRCAPARTTKKPLAGKSLAMIFLKSSTRTRVSFEVGTWQLGGHALFLSPRDVQIGRGEPIPDTARVLSRYVDGIMIRTFAHSDVEQLAQYSSVPVINGLTDLLHPVPGARRPAHDPQRLGTYEGKKVAWIGDGNNMANSWINAAYRLGFELDTRVSRGLRPRPDDARARAARREGHVGARPERGRRGRARREHRRVGVDGAGGRNRRSGRRRSPGITVDAAAHEARGTRMRSSCTVSRRIAAKRLPPK